MSYVSRAIELAQEYHRGIEYNPGESYFDGHLQVVARRVIDLGYTDPNTVAAAYLHDVLEDTNATPELLESEGFTVPTIRAIEALTHQDEEPLEVYLARVCLVPRAVPIKFADSEQNLLATIRSGPKHPKYLRWMQKYPSNLMLLQPLLPDPAELRAV